MLNSLAGIDRLVDYLRGSEDGRVAAGCGEARHKRRLVVDGSEARHLPLLFFWCGLEEVIIRRLDESRFLLTRQAVKLAFDGEVLKKFTTVILQYVFSKGFLKKAQNGTLYQGMSLNIYMLLLTCLQVPDTSASGWRQQVCTETLIKNLRVALDSEAAKKNTILTYLQ